MGGRSDKVLLHRDLHTRTRGMWGRVCLRWRGIWQQQLGDSWACCAAWCHVPHEHKGCSITSPTAGALFLIWINRCTKRLNNWA